MRLPILKVFFVIPICMVAPFVTTQAGEWMRGAVAVTSVSGEVALEEVGGESVRLSVADELPLYFSGLLNVRTAQASEAVFLKTSNQISIYNAGTGFFAIERFEQELGASSEQGKSRMILHLRQGLLAVDNRALSEASQMIVETPLGRISVKNGWWLMEIAYDERSHIYDFSIECADGVLRFTDRPGATYTLRSGQRLLGAGVSSRPSIEVAEISEDASEFFEEFSELEAGVDSMELSQDAFRAAMRAIGNVAEPERSTATGEFGASAGKRPLIIEYAPQSPPVTPFRAVIRAPSRYEADLF